MNELLLHVFNGAVTGSLYVLVALGITVIFGLTKIVNFAHGQFLVLGAFLGFELTNRGWGFWPTLVVATALVAAAAVVADRLLFRFTANRPLNGLVVGMGLLVVMQALTVERWGPDPVQVGRAVSGSVSVGDLSFSLPRLLALALAGTATVAVLVGIRRTGLGRYLRAAHENPVAAAHVGVPVSRVGIVTFAGGTGLAGFAGVILGSLYPIGAYEGGPILLRGFAVALLGGLGNVSGAVIAALLFGLAETMVAAYSNPAWTPLLTFSTIILVLVVRPGGLFASPTGHGEIGAAHDRWRTPLRDRRLPPVQLLILAALPFVYANVGQASLRFAMTTALVLALVSYGVSHLYHNTGMLSFAQAGLMAVGAYVGAILFHSHGVGFWAALPLAVVAGGIFGALVGYPAARARGHYFLLLTFSFGEVAVLVARNWSSLTRGDAGMYVASVPDSIGPIEFQSPTALFGLAYALVVIVAFSVHLFRRTTIGLRLRSVRENPVLAAGLGLNVVRYKVISFGISGAIAGLGGILFVYVNQVVQPDAFGIFIAFQIVAIVLIGGDAFIGPLLGALVVVIIPELLHLEPATQHLAQGSLLILVMLLLPAGVVPTLRGLLLRLVRTGAGRVTPRSSAGDQPLSGVRLDVRMPEETR